MTLIPNGPIRIAAVEAVAHLVTHTRLELIEMTREKAEGYVPPTFQRKLRVTKKVKDGTEQIRHTKVIPGVIKLGVFEGSLYLVDGLHRLYAFLLSGVLLGYVDAVTKYYTSMAEMAQDYIDSNTPWANRVPDDNLKALELKNGNLEQIRRLCPYVGYDYVRRNVHGPVMSMSVALRCWAGSRPDVPSLTAVTARTVAETLTPEATTELTDFLGLCFASWRRDPEYRPLWGSLNIVLCGWLYRRVVLAQTGKATRLNAADFQRGLVALSAASEYVDFLVGRHVSERDRSPTYNRIKAIFSARYVADYNRKLWLPQPEWAGHPDGRRRG